MVKRYTSMAYKNADDMIFGTAVHPVKAELGLQVGAGYVTAEVNYAPRPEAGVSKEKLVSEYRKLTTDIMARAVQIGFPAVSLETEHVEQMTNNPTWGGEIAHVQKTILEEYHEEYGIKCGLRHTPGDIREDRDLLALIGDKYDTLMESFEAVADGGADFLSIETMGGKEILDYAVLRNDVPGMIYAIGCLGGMDMEMIWTDIKKIADKKGRIAAGDTDCAQANTAMFIAGGLLDKNLAHTLAILARVIAGSRTLVGYEAGAQGPGKDCGYENTIVKAITGCPIAQEGKSATCAHADVMGNLTMQVCDLWSNESVEYHGEFGGTSVQCWSQTLNMDAALMNTAIQTGNAKVLRDMMALSDKYRDPQGYILAYDNAFKVGQAIVKDGNDLYLRAKNAVTETIKILEASKKEGKLIMSRFEQNALADAKASVDALTNEKDTFMSDSLAKYKAEVKVFRPETNYKW
ncbi:MAG: methanol---5-hydroxybenzimidazolylcobamide Co-methyltransferase [Methanolobus sp.]|nr:methanol---5-hydroxybenzimidazolylcobamide Co-methyltransferase [Methanolobus sp.]